MKKTNTVRCEKPKLSYVEAQIEIIKFDCDADILTTSSPFDENQGEWDPQI